MEPMKVVADNFIDPTAKHSKKAWYAWSGAALALLAVASGLYFFSSIAENKPEAPAVYFNPSLKVILTYPAAWWPTLELLDTDGLPKRFVGPSGWFEIGATSGEGVILTEIAASLNSATSLPFGQNPKISNVQIAGQPGVVIVPVEEGYYQMAAVVMYPEPIEIGFNSYRFLILKTDLNHAVDLLNSLKFVSNTADQIIGLPNIMVYAPPQHTRLNSPFTVSGIARTFESNVNLKVLNQKKQTIWTGYVTANAPEIGTYGGFSTTVNLSGAAIESGEAAALEVYQLSAEDGRETDKVIVPLQLETIQPTQIVEAYFGQTGKSEDDCVIVFPVERHVSTSSSLAQTAVEELIKGPTLQERQQGYFTSLPPAVIINSLKITEGKAEIDFSPSLEQGVGGSCRVLAIQAQIEKTLKQFASVKEVLISINGRTEDILQP